MKNTHHQEFLKSFFTKKDIYQEQEVNNFVLVYSWNGGTHEWQVGIYTQESFKNINNMDYLESKKIHCKDKIYGHYFSCVGGECSHCGISQYALSGMVLRKIDNEDMLEVERKLEKL